MMEVQPESIAVVQPRNEYSYALYLGYYYRDFKQQPLMEWQWHSGVILLVPDLNCYFVRFFCNHLLLENSWFAIVVTA